MSQKTITAPKSAPKTRAPSHGDPKKGTLPARLARETNKSHVIRELWKTGRWTRTQIQKALGLNSFQQVYNTTSRSTKGYDASKYGGPKS